MLRVVLIQNYNLSFCPYREEVCVHPVFHHGLSDRHHPGSHSMGSPPQKEQGQVKTQTGARR